jgi:hypothetical protein
MRRWFVLWLASIVVVAGLTPVLMRAQDPKVAPPFGGQDPFTEGRVVSGADLGFRVDSINQAGEPVGTFVIRRNGQWVPARFAAGVRPAY